MANKEKIEKGRCMICGEKLDNKFAYMHFICAEAIYEAKRNRIKKLLEKYGNGLEYERKLINEDDLK